MSDHIFTGKSVIKAEAESLMALAEKLDNRFSQAVECILATSGRVILAGMGKSGHIAKKISATFSSNHLLSSSNLSLATIISLFC